MHSLQEDSVCVVSSPRAGPWPAPGHGSCDLFAYKPEWLSVPNCQHMAAKDHSQTIHRPDVCGSISWRGSLFCVTAGVRGTMRAWLADGSLGSWGIPDAGKCRELGAFF